MRATRTPAIPIAIAVALVAACEGAPQSSVSTASTTPSVNVPASPVPTGERSAGGEVVVAVGDIVCEPTDGDFDGHDPGACQHRATAKLVARVDPAAVLALGDLQYPDGALKWFRVGYDRSWGRFASITFPAPGNHEHERFGAQGYFDYWASKGQPTGRNGFYSFDLGMWHLVSLDSNCSEVGCEQGSAQNVFLERDLARTRQPCILAYWHHPYFNSGSVHGEEMIPGVEAFWGDLLAAHADLVLNGHEHDYQRYGKQDASGDARADGIREFVVGTGGKSHYALLDRKDPNYETGDDTHFGVLRLVLAKDSYSWEFVAVGGAVLDRGGPTHCH